MTFEKIFNDLVSNEISLKDAETLMSEPDKMKTYNYYAHILDRSTEPLNDRQMQELQAIVNILQILYNSSFDSPVSDDTYDLLQETLVNMGIPRLTGTIEINDNTKVGHKFKNLRGTLDKVYYLSPDESRTNKSRKYLDEWIRSTEALYKRKTGKDIDLNQVQILLQCKFDGSSCIMQMDDGKPIWITRGDTNNNLASDVSHVMKIFNDVYATEDNIGVKFEVMMTEENKDKINEFYKEKPYHNSRQIVTSILNSNEVDFKVEYLYPVPLRIMHEHDTSESIHPMLIEKFPTMICTFGDRDMIREFGMKNRYAIVDGMRFRTDGVVMTIIDKEVREILGRDGNINNFEVAYKHTEESGITKVKGVEFYSSDFGFVTPVVVTNDIILKGNVINHISLANKERFDELDLHYGDEIRIHYDIIPYATIDSTCKRVPNGRKISFVTECPRCHEDLDLNVIQVQCHNPNCPSRLIGRVLNYCNNMRIKNIGFNTLDMIWASGLLPHGIRSLYKFKKKMNELEMLEGFGKLKTKKIVSEIEAKRKIHDYLFFGSIGIEGLSVKSFQMIMSNIKCNEFIDMIKLKNFQLLKERIIIIPGLGDKKADMIVNFFKNPKEYKEFFKLLNEVTLIETYGFNQLNSRVVFTGCRPTDEMIQMLNAKGYDATASWSKSAKYLVVPNKSFSSSKVSQATELGIPIITINELDKIK